MSLRSPRCNLGVKALDDVLVWHKHSGPIFVVSKRLGNCCYLLRLIVEITSDSLLEHPVEWPIQDYGKPLKLFGKLVIEVD